MVSILKICTVRSPAAGTCVYQCLTNTGGGGEGAGGVRT